MNKREPKEKKKKKKPNFEKQQFPYIQRVFVWTSSSFEQVEFTTLIIEGFPALIPLRANQYSNYENIAFQLKEIT